MERILTEVEAYDLLSRYNIPVPPYGLAKNADEAKAIADKIGYPVVLKLVSPDVIHKTDIGGVLLNLKTPEQVKEGFEKIVRNLEEKKPDARFEGVLVVKYISQKGIELILGAKHDPSFEKVIIFGSGGTLVELLKDYTMNLIPLDEDEIDEMVKSIKLYPLIKGYRGEKPKDERKLKEIIKNFSKLLEENGGIKEFDLNPLVLFEEGAVVLDAKGVITDKMDLIPWGVNKKGLDKLFYPRSIAVVGASREPDTIGYAVLKNLMHFDGRIYPVNPKYKTVMGMASYPKVSSIPGRVDMAVIVVPPKVVPEVIEDCGKKGVEVAVVITAGFSETGNKELEDKVMEIAEREGVRIVGPNVVGVINTQNGMNATFAPLTPSKGKMAFVSQSGAIITTVIDWSLMEGFGFSKVVSLGNKRDVNFADILSYLEDDKETKAVVIYIEGLKKGRFLIEMIRKMKTPVVVIKAGMTKASQEAAKSHTGSLAGDYEVYIAAFRKARAVKCFSTTEAFKAAEILANQPIPKGKRVLIIGNAGGYGVLSADYANIYGLELPQLPEEMVKKLDEKLPNNWNRHNPMDIVGDASIERFAYVFDIVREFHELWDAIVTVVAPSAAIDSRRLAAEIIMLQEDIAKPVIPCMMGGESSRSGIHMLRQNGIPNFPDVELAFRVLGKICEATSRK